MKKLLFGVLAGFSMAAQAAELNVWCGIPPLVSVVNEVGGDRVRVQSLMNSSQDPHTWSPTPKAVAGVRAAALFFTVGMPFEETVARKLAGMNSGLRIIHTASGLDTTIDPHVWLSLPNLSIIADSVREALVQADPAGEAVYRRNCSAYQQRLETEHERLRRKLAPLEGRTFYVYHPVFGYFAHDYGLKQGVVELEGKSPSPKDLLALINRAKGAQVRVVFVQPQFSQRPAKIIADRIGGAVIAIDPLLENPVEVIEKAADTLAQSYANNL